MGMLEDIAIYLSDLDIGVYPGTQATRTICVDEMPDTPDLVIALAARPGKRKDMKTDLQEPELHVEVRAATYLAAQAKAEAIDAALHGQHDTTINGHKYVLIQSLGVPCKLEVDSRHRTVFYENFRIMKGA